MCPCQKAAGGVTVADVAVSRFDALSDTELHKDLFTSLQEVGSSRVRFQMMSLEF
jgi:hypothetical protein